MSGDPPRLLDASGASSALRLGLEAARSDLPDAARLSRLAARLPLGGAPATPSDGPSAPPGPAPAAVAGGTSGVLASAAIGAAVGIALLGGAWLMPSRGEALMRRSPPAGIAAPAPAVAARDEAPRAATLPPVPTPATSRLAPRLVGPPPEPTSEPSRPTPGSTETETGLLQRAQDALTSRPAEALALTDVHLARFPGGALAQEREVIAIAALVALGQTDAARVRASRFIALYPSSAHRRRLEVLVR